MKKILSIGYTAVCFLLPLFTPSSILATEKPISKIRFFSDMDDTVKISYVHKFAQNAAFSVYPDMLFYGMNSVYAAAQSNQKKQGVDVKFSYVSNGVDFTVNKTHRELLRNYRFPNPDSHHPMTLREKIKKVPHKFDVITAAIFQDWPERVVLIGDNGEKDPAVYEQITKAVQNQAALENRNIEISTYIHMVYDPKDPKTATLKPGQIPFYNAGDLAIHFYKQGLITDKQKYLLVNDVKRKIETEGRYRVWGPLVYPWFKHRNLGLLSPNLCQSFYK